MKIQNRRISITQAIIDAAKQKDSKNCMIAIALRQQIPSVYGIQVDASFIRFSIGTTKPATGIRFAYPTPGIVNHNVAQFDDDRTKVTPFHFQLDGREAYIKPVIPTGPRTPTVKAKAIDGVEAETKQRRDRVRKTSRRYAGTPMVKVFNG